MSDFSIRSATSEGDTAWARLRSALWPGCPAKRHALERELYLRSPEVVALAVDENDHAFGFAEVSIRREHVTGSRGEAVPYLEGWYVHENRRNQGIGRALIDFVCTWAKNSGYIEIASDAEMMNTSSQRAHERLGFREVERTISYLRNLDE